MRGKVKFSKFPEGIYYCRIVKVSLALNSKQEEILVIKYELVDDPERTFTERLNTVSSAFLKGIGEPWERGCEWDSENWLHKYVWVKVAYSPDEFQWQRFAHFPNDPRLPELLPQEALGPKPPPPERAHPSVKKPLPPDPELDSPPIPADDDSIPF